jgi:hypothetical protein
MEDAEEKPNPLTPKEIPEPDEEQQEHVPESGSKEQPSRASRSRSPSRPYEPIVIQQPKTPPARSRTPSPPPQPTVTTTTTATKKLKPLTTIKPLLKAPTAQKAGGEPPKQQKLKTPPKDPKPTEPKPLSKAPTGPKAGGEPPKKKSPPKPTQADARRMLQMTIKKLEKEKKELEKGNLMILFLT